MKQDNQISADQMELIERFLAAHNGIENYLRRNLDRDQDVPYREMARTFARQHKTIPGVDDLWLFADLRNSIVHGKTAAYEYLSVPLPHIVKGIERLRDYLLRPPRVLAKIPRKVEIVDEVEPLMRVLELIKDKSFSQFPVYHEGQFRGLLTENGIARWIAHHAHHEMSLIELADFAVKSVLREEEKRRTFEFMPETTTVDEALERFAENSELEAVLITHSGSKNEKLLGIITPWDVAKLKNID